MSDYQHSFDFTFPEPTLPQLWTPDDIYGAADQRILTQFGEDHRVERKRAAIKKRDLAEYVSMWANTQPLGGVVFIGVADDGAVIGCKGTDGNHISDLRSVREYCSDARLEFKDVPITNHNGEPDYIVAMRVHYREDKLVETSWNEAFIREGKDKRRLTEAEKREIRLQKGELDVESERVTLSFPNDFDPVLMEDFRVQFLTKRRIKTAYSLAEVLTLAKLGRNSRGVFEPNLACALLFAKDPRQALPGAFIRIIRYDGTEERFGQRQNIISDYVVEGPLPHQIVEAEQYISSQIRKFIRMGIDSRFANTPEYPKTVWLEAIVNAVCHRSYNLRHMNVFVKMFEDKMVIESPGAFMPPTTPETVYDSHNPRNPNLMWALYYFDYVQCAYEGTRRMRDDMRTANLPDPIFDQKQVGTFKINVTLKNNVEHRKFYVRSEASHVINPDIYASLTESEKMVVNFLADKDRINVKDTGLLIGRDWRGADAVLQSLVSKGIIERSAGKYRSKHRFYYLKAAAKPKQPASKE
jgi:ATP-dependent DNA helicase RecG